MSLKKNLNCEVRGDKLFRKVDESIKLANDEDWHTEYLDKTVSIKTILAGVEEAVSHINFYGSGHTDAILSEDKTLSDIFLIMLIAELLCIIHQLNSQMEEEFGMGAEIGISTSKVHARGPVGVAQLTSFKYKVRGIRPN